MSRYIKGCDPGNGFTRRAGMRRLMRFWRVRFRGLRAPAASALRRGQVLPPLSPRPFSLLAALCLRWAPDKFLLTKQNTSQHNREASIDTLRQCSGSSRNALRLPSGTSVQLHRNPQGATTLNHWVCFVLRASPFEALSCQSRQTLDPYRDCPERKCVGVHRSCGQGSFDRVV